MSGRLDCALERLWPEGGRGDPALALRRLPGRVAEWYVRPLLLRARVEHLAGPREVECSPRDVVAVSVVRNGELHLRSFLDHHFGIGVRHVVLLDNGSTDATVEIARDFGAVTLLRTSCPYRKYETTFRRYLARRFARGRWHLCVDVDERFEYPGADRIPLATFVEYLDRHRFTAVVAQMLDLFPEAALDDPRAGDDFERTHCLYDLSAVETDAYRWGEGVDPAVRMHVGGVRAAAFGTANGLSKAALARVDDRIELAVDWHHVRHARVADVTCLLRHYPFAGDFHGKARDAAATGRYGRSATGEYVRYWETLRRNPGLRLGTPAARRYAGLEPLVSEGFLVRSPAYERWVEEHASTATASR